VTGGHGGVVTGGHGTLHWQLMVMCRTMAPGGTWQWHGLPGVTEGIIGCPGQLAVLMLEVALVPVAAAASPPGSELAYAAVEPRVVSAATKRPTAAPYLMRIPMMVPAWE